MRLRLDPHQPVAPGIRRVARKEAERARAAIASARPLGAANVHALRKSLKRLRALMKLVGESGRGRLRKASQTLAPIRDLDVVGVTLKALSAGERPLLQGRVLASIDLRLRSEHKNLLRAYREHGRLDELESALRAATVRFAKWHPDRPGFDVCVPGLARAHRRCRKALLRAAARGSDADFHEWRKRLSVVRDHLLLIAPPGSQVHAEAMALDRAVTSLGDDHNLSVVMDTLERLAGDQPLGVDMVRFRRGVVQRQTQLRRNAFTNASEICLLDSDVYARRLAAAWARARTSRTSYRPPVK